MADHPLSDVGGTPGGLGDFLIGFAMSCVGGYLLTNQVTVAGSYWTFYGTNTFGITLIPMLIGVGMLFFNGRNPIGWSLIGQQGFPAITVPAGFTTQAWDRVRDSNGGARLAGPIQASLPVGVDFIARPFDEAMLIRIASAYEAATHHRKPPPDFGPLPGEP